MTILIFILAGSIAQLVDGALGMGFGLTSSTLLITLGASAVVTSAAVHVAEIGTTLASGIAHWRRDNVDKQILLWLAIPGGIGAFSGATFLASLTLEKGKVFISTILLVLGFLLLYRNIFLGQGTLFPNAQINSRYIKFLGFSGGFVDAAGGGGWGPVVTPTLLVTTQTEPRKVIGTVSAAEFIVALSATAGFALQLNRLDIDWEVIAGLAIGGVLMAPVAAFLVSKLPRKPLGIAISLAIIIINGYRLVVA